MSKRYGKIEQGKTCEKTFEEREIEWKVMNISSLINSGELVYESPDFSFAGNSWCFQLHPKLVNINGRMCFYLYKVNRNDYSVEYTYGIKKNDGNVDHFGGGIFKEGGPKHSELCYFIKVSEFEQRKSELAPSDVLTLTYILKRGIPNSQQPKLKKLIKLDTLSENFKHLFSTRENCDTILHVQDKEFKVHKAVLIARSSVLAAMFHHETKEKQTGIISIPDCNPESFEEFLEFIYCGKLEGISSRSAIQLYETSDKYDVQELKTFCIEYLMKNLTVGDFCDSVIMADKYDDVKLFSAAQGFFNENATDVLQSSEWELLMKKNFRLGNKLMIEMSKKAKIEK